MFAYHPQHDSFAQIYNDPTCIATYRRKLYVREDTFKCMIWIIKSRRPLPCGVSRMMCIFMRARAMRGNRVSMSISCGYFNNMWKWKWIPEAAEWHVRAQTNSLLFFSHIYTLCVHITVIVKRRYTTPKPPSNGLYTRQYAHYSRASRNTNWLIAKRNGVMVCICDVSLFFVCATWNCHTAPQTIIYMSIRVYTYRSIAYRALAWIYLRVSRGECPEREHFTYFSQGSRRCAKQSPPLNFLFGCEASSRAFLFACRKAKRLAGDSPHVWWQFI